MFRRSVSGGPGSVGKFRRRPESEQFQRRDLFVPSVRLMLKHRRFDIFPVFSVHSPLAPPAGHKQPPGQNTKQQPDAVGQQDRGKKTHKPKKHHYVYLGVCRRTRSGFERPFFPPAASGCIDDRPNIACFAVLARRKNGSPSGRRRSPPTDSSPKVAARSSLRFARPQEIPLNEPKQGIIRPKNELGLVPADTGLI